MVNDIRYIVSFWSHTTASFSVLRNNVRNGHLKISPQIYWELKKCRKPYQAGEALYPLPVWTNPQTPPLSTLLPIWHPRLIFQNRQCECYARYGIVHAVQTSLGLPSHIRRSHLDPEADGHQHRRIRIREVVDGPKRREGRSQVWPLASAADARLSTLPLPLPSPSLLSPRHTAGEAE